MSEPISNAELFYSGDKPVVGTYEPSLADSMNALRDSAGMSAVDHDKLMLESAHFFHGANIQGGLAQKLHSHIVQALKTPPSEEVLAQWQTESRKQLRQKYGEDADRRVKIANEYVASHPTIRKQLDDSGVGSHPDVILALAERANRLRPRRK